MHHDPIGFRTRTKNRERGAYWSESVRFWLSGPRLFNGLLRPGISFSGRELKARGKKAPKVSEDATLGICRRPDGAMLLAIPGMNGTNEHAECVPVAAFFFSRVDDATEVRNGALQRLGGRVGTDDWISDKSLGQITQAVRPCSRPAKVQAVHFDVSISNLNCL